MYLDICVRFVFRYMELDKSFFWSLVCKDIFWTYHSEKEYIGAKIKAIVFDQELLLLEAGMKRRRHCCIHSVAGDNQLFKRGWAIIHILCGKMKILDEKQHRTHLQIHCYNCNSKALLIHFLSAVAEAYGLNSSFFPATHPSKQSPLSV